MIILFLYLIRFNNDLFIFKIMFYLCLIFRFTVLFRIEKVVEAVIAMLADSRPPFLSITDVRTWRNIRFEKDKGFQMSERPEMSTVSFQSLASVKKMGLMLKVLSMIYRHVQCNTTATKRDMFYQDPQLFGSQSCLDGIVNDVALLLEVPRWQLHVLATAKGLVAGDIVFADGSGTLFDCSKFSQGLLLPNNVQEITIVKSSALFVFVIEKDATFQRLLEDDFIGRLGPCILITGKGFPDVSTRMFLNLLWNSYHIPTFGLFDADPHGIEIMSVYKFGSKALCSNGDALALPAMKWLGILPSDIDKYHIPQEALLPLTTLDVKKAQHLLKRPFVASHPQWKLEIEILLNKQKKAEIQSLDSITDFFLFDFYIQDKLQYRGWI